MPTSSNFTVKIEPDVSKLDALYSIECPLPSFPPSKLSKGMDRQARDISDTTTRSLYQKIVGGEHIFLTIHPSDFDGRPILLVQVHEEDSERDDDTVPPLNFALAEGPMNNIMCSPNMMHDGMDRKLPDYLVDALCQRTAHWLIRQHISKLSIMETKLVFDYLLNKCSERCSWTDLYDIAVLRCKWILAKHPNTGSKEDCPGYAINKVGETLEAMKQFDQAALIYREGLSLIDDKGDQALLALNGGLAFKRNLDYAEAEPLYLQSIRLTFETTSSFHPNSESFAVPLGNIVMLYDEWSRSLRDNRTGAMLNSVEFQVQAPFIALLHYAGWHGNGISFLMASMQQFHQMGVVKQAYRNRKRAIQRLRDAFGNSQDDTTTFRNMILNTRNTSVTNCMMPIGAQSNEKQNRKEDKSRARELLKPTKIADLVECANCSTMLDNPKRCPCHTVHYCNQECQKIHWRAGHKNNCPKYGKAKT